MNKNNQYSEINEIMQALRTNIYFLEDKETKVIACTSTVQSEGKSFIASNFAMAAAVAGEKVLLVDCDIRRPKVHENFKLKVNFGFNDVLSGRKKWPDILHKGVQKNLDLLPSKHQKNVSELFSKRFLENLLEEFKKEYDLIVLDTPPILVAADAALLSRYSDGVVYVCGYNMVKKTELLHARRVLRRAGANIYGIVVNKVNGPAYSIGNYGYHSYSYDYSENK